MTLADIPFGMRLKETAGWNQVEDDWRRILEQRPEGCFIGSIDGIDAGTGTTTRYESIGWIGMILVDPPYRRRGLATELMRATIESFEGTGATLKLDATPAGQTVYERLGFVEERPLGRWVLPKEELTRRTFERSAAVRAIETSDLARIVEIDRAVFGAARTWILDELYRRLPERAFCIERSGEVEAYCFGRDGSRFDKVAPLIAKREDDALELLDASIGSFVEDESTKDFALDVLDPTPTWEAALCERGFIHERPLVRMYLGKNETPGRPDRQWTIVGYDLG